MSFQAEIDKAIKEKKLYFIGDALPVDWYAGFKLWLAHAEAGDAKAQYNVGRCYDRGDGIDQDKEKALQWYLKAAEKNDCRAYFNLYLYYSSDKLNISSCEKAERYLQNAFELHEPRAIEVLNHRETVKAVTHAEQLKEKVQSFLYKNDFDKVEKILKEAINENHDWAKITLAAINLEFSDFILTDRAERHFISSDAIVNGTSVGGYYVKKFMFTYNFEVKNLSNQSKTVISLGLSVPPNISSVFDSAWKRIELGPNESKKISMECGTNRVELWNYYVIDLMPDSTETYKQFNGELKTNNKIRFLKIPFRKTPAVIDKVKGNGWGPECFVITTCCGDVNHPIVRNFRDFRDDHLTNSVAGRWLITKYYIYGPIIAKFIETKPLTKRVLLYFFTFISKQLPKNK